MRTMYSSRCRLHTLWPLTVCLITEFSLDESCIFGPMVINNTDHHHLVLKAELQVHPYVHIYFFYKSPIQVPDL